MNLNILSRRTTKRFFADLDQTMSVERLKRQRTLSHELLDWFSPRHNPAIFLDNRLRSRLFK